MDGEEDGPNAPEHGVSRRGALIGGAVAFGAVAAGILGQATIQRAAATGAGGGTDATTDAVPLRRYASTDLTVPEITSRPNGPTAPGYVFVNPSGDDGFQGLIMENSGEPVWIEPTGAYVTDLRVQGYGGEPVLTYWSGKGLGGHGEGSGTILDTRYREVATVHAGNGLEADLHEFSLTDRGTALLTAYEPVSYDLSGLGGPKDGHLYDCHAQEVDIATGRVLLDWSALEHVPVNDTFMDPNNPDRPHHHGTSPDEGFDPFHMNAIDDDGERLLVSLRHTHTVYAIDRKSGDVLWRLGGRHSDFHLAPQARFAWQHDIRRNPDGRYSLFDNHLISGTNGVSRGLFFRLDEEAGVAHLDAHYEYGHHLGHAMGSVQRLDNGNVLVGWGTAPFVTEFDADGSAVYEARDVGSMSYRANRSVWDAQPATRPDVAARRRGEKMRVFASWNGATRVARWRILTGAGSSSLTPVLTVPRRGFETHVDVPHAAVAAVQALDADGRVLASSRAVAAHR